MPFYVKSWNGIVHVTDRFTSTIHYTNEALNRIWGHMFLWHRHKSGIHIARRQGHKEYMRIHPLHGHLIFICIWSVLILESTFAQTSDQQHLPPRNSHPFKILWLFPGKPLSSRAHLSRILDLDQHQMSSCWWFSEAVVRKTSYLSGKGYLNCIYHFV